MKIIFFRLLWLADQGAKQANGFDSQRMHQLMHNMDWVIQMKLAFTQYNLSLRAKLTQTSNNSEADLYVLTAVLWPALLSTVQTTQETKGHQNVLVKSFLCGTSEGVSACVCRGPAATAAFTVTQIKQEGCGHQSRWHCEKKKKKKKTQQWS